MGYKAVFIPFKVRLRLSSSTELKRGASGIIPTCGPPLKHASICGAIGVLFVCVLFPLRTHLWVGEAMGVLLPVRLCAVFYENAKA